MESADLYWHPRKKPRSWKRVAFVAGVLSVTVLAVLLMLWSRGVPMPP